MWVPRQGPVPTAHVGKGSSPPPTFSTPLAPTCLKSVSMVLPGVIFRGPRPFSETQPHSRSHGPGPCLWGSLSAQSPVLSSALTTKRLLSEPRSLVLACPGFMCLSAALGLVCGVQAFSSCGEPCLLLLWCVGSWCASLGVVVPGQSCSVACGDHPGTGIELGLPTVQV